MSDHPHIPVLRDTVIHTLQPQKGETVLDVTLGLGGHAEAFLECIGPGGTFIGLDADSQNLARARERLQHRGTIDLRHTNFGALPHLHLPPLDILFADLGLSSPHLDDPERGFSFRFEGPLDLRFDRTTGRTAADVLCESDEDDLKQMFRTYGELFKEAHKLGHMLAGAHIATTTELKTTVEEGFGYRAKQILPQVFQALRIAVNDELSVLQTLLSYGPQMLKPGGRMGVLSYHSLEDRMVKHSFRALCEPLKDEITGKVAVPAGFEMLTKKAVQASPEEIEHNPRARSVKFRALRRVVR